MNSARICPRMQTKLRNNCTQSRIKGDFDLENDFQGNFHDPDSDLENDFQGKFLFKETRT